MNCPSLKKSTEISVEEKRRCIEPNHRKLSIARQCTLLGLARSSYYAGLSQAVASEAELAIMRRLDEMYTERPCGTRTMAARLCLDTGKAVNRKKVQRLMRTMGLAGIVPKRRQTPPAKPHKVFPYLLRNRQITMPNEVWCSDITYIPMANGFMYLVAVMDWYSRCILSWELSNTLDTAFCLNALHGALEGCGVPAIFNTDQGSQFTSEAWINCLQQRQITISMDGRGRALDNVFIERFWRSLKYEDIYLKDYDSVFSLHRGIQAYVAYYNHRRPHQGLQNHTPARVYAARLPGAHTA